MSEKPVENTDTKPIKEKSSDDILFETLAKMIFWLLSTPIASIIIGFSMVMWYDLIGDFWKNSGKGIILWLFWSRPVGVIFVCFGVIFVCLGLKEIWKRNFSESKIKKTE